MAPSFIEVVDEFFKEFDIKPKEFAAELGGGHHHCGVRGTTACVAVGALFGPKPLSSDEPTGCYGVAHQRKPSPLLIHGSVQKARDHCVIALRRVPGKQVGMYPLHGYPSLFGKTPPFLDSHSGSINRRYVAGLDRPRHRVPAFPTGEFQHRSMGAQQMESRFQKDVGLGAEAVLFAVVTLIPERSRVFTSI